MAFSQQLPKVCPKDLKKENKYVGKKVPSKQSIGFGWKSMRVSIV